MIKKLRRIPHLIVLLIMANIAMVTAQEVENILEYRSALELNFQPLEKVEFNLSPELRFDDSFSKDEFIMEAAVDYSPIELLSFEVIYRFVANSRDNKETEFNNKYSLGVALTKDIGRWMPSLKVRYTNYADDDIDDKKYLRYKAAVKYNIKDCKMTPFVATEVFHQLSDASIQKMRYSGGMSYKLFKNNYIKVSYKLDYYLDDLKNKHIISLGYKIKL